VPSNARTRVGQGLKAMLEVPTLQLRARWWNGYSLSAKRRTIERPKAFLSVQQTVMPNKPRPQFVALMAAVALKEPFDRPYWIFKPESKSVAISRFVGSIFIA